MKWLRKSSGKKAQLAAAKPHPLPQPPRRAPLMMSLEPRFMFDGAVAASHAEAPHLAGEAGHLHMLDHLRAIENATRPPAAAAVPAAATGPAVVFVDSRVEDVASLLKGVAPGTEVVTLSADRDGLQQIADYLAQHHEVGSVEIVAHGSDGELQLGATDLTAASIASHAQTLGTIGANLKQGADILVYACDTAADVAGVAFVDTLATLTGHAVAASSNLTGVDGDWTLEITTGDISAVPVLSASAEALYTHDLAAESAATLQAAINATASDSGNDTVTLTGDVTFSSASTITVNHTGSGTLTIDGAGHTIDAADFSRVFQVTSGKVILENITIKDGLLAGTGGNGDLAGGASMGAGISNAGTLTLNNVVVTTNVATGGGGGGGASGGNVGFAGGGGSGAGGRGGASSGTSNPATYGPNTGGGSTGGTGGSFGATYGGGGGSASSGGGNGGSDGGGFYAGGGKGGTATSGITAGGGGGGTGFNASAGNGGNAVGGIYNSGKLYVIGTSQIVSNLGAGGGGGGGGGSGNHSGSGGEGVGGIWNTSGGKVYMTATAYSAMGATNKGGSGLGGSAFNSGSAGVTPAGFSKINTGSGTIVTNYAPAVTSIVLASGSSPNNGTSEQFTVTFSEGVTGVDLTDFTATTTGTVADTSLSESGTSGGTTYTVTVNGVSGDGTLRLDLNSSGTGIQDSSAVAIAGGYTSGQVVTIDHTVPTVSSINRSGSTPNDASSESFTVTFSESVTGVDATDFTAALTGTAADTGITVTPVSGSTYTVTINGVTGDGTIGLNLKSSGTGIADTAGNAITAGFTGQVYTVDHTAPTVTSISASDPSPNNTNTLDYTVTFSEGVTGVDLTDFSLTTSGVTAGPISVTALSASVYNVTIDNVVGNGTLRLDLKSSGTGIADLASNAIASGFTGGDVFTVDQTPPTVSSITRVGSTPNNAASDQYTVTFSESVTGVDTTDFTLTTTGTAAGTIASVSGSGTTYTVTINSVTGDGTMRLDLNSSGTGIEDTATNAISGGFTAGQTYTLDHTAPTVSSIVRAGSTPNNASSEQFTVTFSESVTGVDTSDFGLTETGTAAGTIASVSGSGTTYTVTVNSVTGDGTMRLDLNSSGTGIQDAVGNAIASGFTAGQVYTIDHTAPSVTSVGVPSNGTYAIGQDLDFTVNFSESVTVDTSGGTPYLTLTLGAGDVNAFYVSGSGTSNLVFRYVVADGDADTDGIAIGGSITTNSGTIRDAVGNNAVDTLNSVASTTGVLVDGVRPTASSIDIVGSATNNANSDQFTVTFSEAVSGVDASDFTLVGSGTTSGSVTSVTGSGTTWTVTVGSVSGDGTLRLDLNNAGDPITDTAGNTLTASHMGDQSYTVDHTAPSAVSMTVPADGTYIAGDNLDFTVTFGENVTVDTTGGTPRIAVNLDTGGTVYANYVSGSGTGTLTFRLVVAAGEQDLTGIVTGTSIDANGGTIRDAATNDAVLAINAVEPSTAGIDVDAILPTVTSVSVPSDGTYALGQDLDFTVDFNKTVTVDTTGGTPEIAITLDSGVVQAQYLSGSGTNALVFRLVVANGEMDTDGIAVAGAITANGGTIRDSLGNDSVLTLTGLPSTTGVLVDGVPPTVTSIDIVGSATNNANSDQFTVTFSEAVTGVNTTDFDAVGTGTTGGTVTNVSGSGTTWTVTVGGVGGDGLLRLDLRTSGHPIIDGAGNAVTAPHTGDQSYTVDRTPPAAVSMTVPADGTYIVGDNLDFTVTYSEVVTVDTSGGTPRIAVTLDTGGTVYANYVSGSGTGTLTFRLVVAAGEQDLTGIVTGTSIDANGGTIRDAATNDAVLAINAVEPSTAGIDIDAILPTVTSVSVPADGTYALGQDLDFTVDFNKTVTVDTTGGTPEIAITLDSGVVQAQYLSGSGTNALVFRLVVANGEMDTDGIAVAGAITANGGTIRDSLGNDSVLTLTGLPSTTGVLVDGVPPTVTSIDIVGSATNNANSDQFTVTFSEAVTGVNTTDFDAVGTGTTGGTVTNVSGSGTTWTVTVGGVGGDGLLRLDLRTSGHPIIDGAGNAVTAPHTGDQSYTVDRTPPAAVSMTVPADGTYIVGDNLDFTVTYSEVVTVDTSGGTPRIAVTLDTGGTVYANYVSGSGTGTLTFRLVVAAGEQDLTGIVTGTSIDANGGTIRDAATNDAVLAINAVEPSTAGIDVDAIAPVVDSVSVPANATYGIGQDLDFTVDFNKAVTVDTTGGTPEIAITLDSGVVQAQYLSGSGTNALVFRLVVANGEMDTDGIAVAGAITANGGTIRDSLGNDSVLTLTGLPSTTGVLVDGVAPTVTSIDIVGNATTNASSDQFTVTFSEAVTGVSTNDFTAVGTGTTGGTVTNVSGSGTTWTVTVGGVGGDGLLRLDLRTSGHPIIDAAGNAVTAPHTGDQSYTVDRTPPAAVSMTVPADGTYIVGDNLDFTVTYSEAVTVDTSGGTPRIAVTLDTGGTVYANYVSGSGTGTLTFRLVVAAGEQDLTGIVTGTSIDANGGTIRDAATNDAVLAINAVEPSTAGIDVDAIAPVVDSVSVPANATYGIGQDLDFTVDFNKAVTVDTSGGTPTIAIALDSGTVQAQYVTGSGTSALVFRLVVANGEVDPNGVVVGNAISANGATIRDHLGADSALALNGVGATTGVRVDGVAPTVAAIERNDPATNNAGSEAFTVTFSENVTGVDASDFTLTDTGTAAGTVASVTGSGRIYTVTVGGVSGDGTMRLDLNASGTGIVDAASNAVASGYTGGEVVTLDHTAPVVSSVAVPANGDYGAGQNLDFTVDFSENVIVDTSGGTPTFDISLDTGGTVHATYVGGSGTSALTFRYVVAAGTLDTNGVMVGTAIALDGATIRDAATNAASLALNGVGATTGVHVDGIAPTAAAIVRTGPATNDATSETFTVTFSESVTGVDASDFALVDTGTAAGTITSVSGSGSSYTVTVGGVSGDGTMRLDLNASGTGIVDAASNAIAGGFTGGQAYTLDHTVPAVTAVGVPASGTYGTGQDLDFTVHYGEAVTVDTAGGTPTLAITLDTGGTVQAQYVGGSGTDALTFRYIVASGNFDPNGVTLGAAVALNGATITDAAANAATLALAGVGSTAGVHVDAIAPTVSAIDRVGPSPSNAGSEQFTVTFSTAVTGVSADDFALHDTGTAAGTIASVSGSGTTYTVTVAGASGDGTMRLDLVTGGHAIVDAFGNTLLAAHTGDQVVTLDHTAPSVVSVGVPAAGLYSLGQDVDITVHYGEAVTVDTATGSPRIAITLDTGGTVYADYVSGSGTGALTFRYVVAAGVMDANGIAVASTIDAHGGTLSDAAGNTASLALAGVGDTSGVRVDGTTPVVSAITATTGAVTNATSETYTVTFSEEVSNVDAHDFVLTGSGSATGTVSSVTAVDGHTYTVTVDDLAGDGSLRLDVQPNSGITDAAGTPVPGFTGGAAYALDHSAPVVTSVTGPAAGTYVEGQQLVFTVTTDSALTVDTSGGTPTLALTLDGGETVQAQLLSSSGDQLSFGYTIVAGDHAAAGVTVGALSLDGASVSDAAGNAIDTTLHGVASTAGVDVDAQSPTIAAVDVPAPGVYTPGQTLTFKVSYSEAVTVDTAGGTPSIDIVLDTGTVHATYVNGSGTGTLTFAYTVVAGNADADGIQLASAIATNGGSITGVNHVPVALALNGVGSTAGVDIGATPPAPIGRGLLDGTSGVAPTISDAPLIWLTDAGSASAAPGADAQILPFTTQVTWSSVPLISAGQLPSALFDVGADQAGASRGLESAVGSSGFSTANPTAIDRLVDPIAADWAAVGDTTIDRVDPLTWQPPTNVQPPSGAAVDRTPIALATPQERLAVPTLQERLATVAVAPVHAMPAGSLAQRAAADAGAGKASLNQQFARHGQKAWEREHALLAQRETPPPQRRTG